VSAEIEMTVRQPEPGEERCAHSGRSVMRGFLGNAAVFGLIYLFLWQLVHPQLLYYVIHLAIPPAGYPLLEGQSIVFPFFLRGTQFFLQFVGRPGGLVEYVSAYLSQYYYYPLVGPAIITAVLVLISLASARLFRKVTGRSARGFQYIPVILLLIPIVRYTFYLREFIALALAVLTAWLYVSLRRRLGGWLPRFFVFLFLAAALHYLVAGPYILFILLSSLVEILQNKHRFRLGAAYLIAGSLVPLTSVYILDVTAREAYVSLLGILPVVYVVKTAALSTTYAFFLFSLASTAVIRRSGFDEVFDETTEVDRTDLGTARFRWKVWAPLMVIVVGLAAAFAGLDRNVRDNLWVNYYARTHQWERTLQAAWKCHKDYFLAFTVQDVNRALYETGQLGDKMFSYPQHPVPLLMSSADGIYYPGYQQMLFDLGSVNDAEHLAHESLELVGERPSILRLLAMINIVKQKPEAARVFLNAMKKDVIHDRWAEEYLTRLEKDPLMTSDPQVKSVRTRMPVEDILMSPEPNMTLMMLLLANRSNRMAFEYLLAYYLCTKQLVPLLESLEIMKNEFKFEQIPEHIAEAVVLYSRMFSRSAPQLFGYKIDPGIYKRFDQFARIMQDIDSENDAGRERELNKKLDATFGNSYFLYFATVHPKGTQ